MQVKQIHAATNATSSPSEEDFLNNFLNKPKYYKFLFLILGCILYVFDQLVIVHS